MPDPRYHRVSKPVPPLRPPKVRSRRLFGQLAFVILVLLAIGVGALAGMLFVYSSNLPQISELFDYRPDVMTSLYADDGSVIGTFALQHRALVTYQQIPPMLRNAIISEEDRHFESHFGVDVLRIVRSAIVDMVEWRKVEGASTLTQQLSRRLFLTPEKSWKRKMQEALLAIQIERHFTKAQIFTLYCNVMPWGAGSFGAEAAAERYFGKRLNEITLPEAAMLAGILRSPDNYYSPIHHPARALARRNEVLASMLSNGKIGDEQYHAAIRTPLGLHVQKWNREVAPYFVDYVRATLLNKYSAATVNTDGLRVYTSLDPALQAIAVKALRDGLRSYDKSRGWRGAEKNIFRRSGEAQNSQPETLETYHDSSWDAPITEDSRIRGLVMAVKPDYALVRFGDLTARITPADFAWTKLATPADVFRAGDVDLFHITSVGERTVQATLDQYPAVQGAILVLDNKTGEIRAMVGGYNYNRSEFNRAAQAERQVGSSFKVYVYSEALLDGMGPFDTILDEPVSYGKWSPHNYDDRFEGRITLLHALAESRNVPAVRLLAEVGIDKVIRLCREFGITSRLVPDLPLALGASSLTLLEHTSAYSTFPDDGLHISPRAITSVSDYEGRRIDDFAPQITEVLPGGVSRLMVSMLREVINSGTAVKAKPLADQYPIAGKTGTTNDFSDAWFIGFSPSITCGVWVGYDDHHTLGKGEEGSHVALPIWIEFMSQALKKQPAQQFPDSPLLTNPIQVKQILASAGPANLYQANPAMQPAPAGASSATVITPSSSRSAIPSGTAQ
ncbi:MAG TPA: PBP1A family penicillin-binding protein [Terriglobia bacterium]|nr:PBP1A family penicillin-binding protein [Terriglobia bacterium]